MTLDQYYYATLDDTQERDDSQVVSRYLDWEREKNAPKEPQILMVDQLWLWIIDESMHPMNSCRENLLTFPPRNHYHKYDKASWTVWRHSFVKCCRQFGFWGDQGHHWLPDVSGVHDGVYHWHHHWLIYAEQSGCPAAEAQVSVGNVLWVH